MDSAFSSLLPPLSCSLPLFCCCTPITLHTFGKICQAFFLVASLFYFLLSLTALYHTRKSQLTLVSSSFQAVQFVWHAKGQRAEARRRVTASICATLTLLCTHSTFIRPVRRGSNNSSNSSSCNNNNNF